MSGLTLLRWLSIAGLLSACDRQVTRNFQGDSLLRITGSVAIPLGFEGRDLVPALAFEGSSPTSQHLCGYRSDYSRIMEVGVQGDFPSRFTLDVFDPPPDDVIAQHQAGEPAYAVGYVAAVPRTHPNAILIAPPDEATVRAWRDIDVAECGAYFPLVGPDATRCYVRHICTFNSTRCLHRTLHCSGPAANTGGENACELVASSGDNSLAVAGYSVNYTVLYFPTPIGAGSQVAEIWGHGAAIAAGYHLYRVQTHMPTSGPVPSCLLDSQSIALEHYNAEHGTDFHSAVFNGSQETGGPEAYFDFQCLSSAAILEQHCDDVLSLLVRKSIEEVKDASVSIELGTISPVTSQ